MAPWKSKGVGRLPIERHGRKSRLSNTQIYSRTVKIMQMSFEKCRKPPDSGHYWAMMPSTFPRYTLPVRREKLRKVVACRMRQPVREIHVHLLRGFSSGPSRAYAAAGVVFGSGFATVAFASASHSMRRFLPHAGQSSSTDSVSMYWPHKHSMQ